MKPKLNTRFLILAITCQLVAISSIESLGQDTVKVLVGEKRNSSKQLTFNVGQSAKYKTSKDKWLQKGVIHEITDSTITFSRGKKITVVPLKDLEEFKAFKPGQRGGGTALIVTGVAGGVLGLFAIGLAEGPNGSGSAGATALIPVGAALLIIAGVAVLQPEIANPATLKAQPIQKLVEEKKKVAAADTVPHYQKLKVGVFGGYAWQSHSEGALVTLEPGIKLNEVAFGLRIESASLTMPGQNFPGNPGATINEAKGTTSVTANVQVYLSEGSFRPFIGFGAGPYFIANPKVSKIGFYPRFGFDVNHITVIMDYNMIPSVTGMVDPNPCSDPANLGNCGGTVSYTQDYSYFAVKLGYTFGGRKK